MIAGRSGNTTRSSCEISEIVSQDAHQADQAKGGQRKISAPQAKNGVTHQRSEDRSYDTCCRKTQPQMVALVKQYGGRIRSHAKESGVAQIHVSHGTTHDVVAHGQRKVYRQEE